MVKEIINLYVYSEMKKKWFLYMKQILFLVPVLTLILVMMSAENVKYINQWEFLHNTLYTSVSWNNSSVSEENCFDVYDGIVSIVKENRGAQVRKKAYSCQIFNLRSNTTYDFDYTYFCKKNMSGFNISTLNDNEIIISYDVAKKLSVDIGDHVSFVSDDNEEIVTYCVAGIMKTKYKYKNIGYVGTVLINSKDEKLKKLYSTNGTCTFYKNQAGQITREEELQDANCLLVSITSNAMINIVMPVFGLLLIVIILYRETRRVVKRIQYNYAVLVTLGMNEKSIYNILARVEAMVLLVSSILAMLLYKYVLMEYYIGRYVGIRVFLIYLGILFGMSMLVLLFCTKKIRNEVLKIDLIQSLKMRNQCI